MDLYIKEAALQGSNSDNNHSSILALCLVAYHWTGKQFRTAWLWFSKTFLTVLNPAYVDAHALVRLRGLDTQHLHTYQSNLTQSLDTNSPVLSINVILALYEFHRCLYVAET